MIISIDAEKEFARIQDPFRINTLNSAGLDDNYVTVKGTYGKRLAHVLPGGERRELCLSEPGAEMPALTTPAQQSPGGSGQGHQARKRNTRGLDRKGKRQTVPGHR